MPYVAVREPGPPDVLVPAEGPLPVLKPGEVLIEVAYAGVNRPDCLQRSGAYPPPADASPIVGLEVSGRIAAVAAGLTQWKVGDEVCALTPGGGYAKYCATPAGFCLPIPAGMTLRKTLQLVAEFRQIDQDTPIVLMGYFNPIYVYKVEPFLTDAAAAGVDGLIIVDAPPEMDDELCLPAVAKGLNFIRLATPTTDAKRLPAVLTNTSGFVYYVSITGITGTATPDALKTHAEVAAIKRSTTLPVVVGFGVKTPEQVKAISAGADGVVVGSALVTQIEKSLDNTGKATSRTVPGLLDLVSSLARPLRNT